MLDDFLSKTAIVLLAHSDYESLEFALAAHCKFLNDNIKLYILINGKGTYDTNRTLDVAKRYYFLLPNNIEIVDDYEENLPYVNIKKLLKSEKLKKYKYIIKIDDDVMPLTDTWVYKLCKCYKTSSEKYGDKLAYVTPLVNNNGYGFEKILEIYSLKDMYYNKLARNHIIGPWEGDPYSPYYISDKNEISTEAHGTIWRNAYVSRWIHNETSLKPHKFVEKTKSLGYDFVDSRYRYSINCMLFEKELFSKIDDNISVDDEHLFHKYCLLSDKIIISDLSIPMIHLFFKTQRSENRDILDQFDLIFQEYLNLPFPIRTRKDRLLEIEDRLRYIEKFYINQLMSNSQSLFNRVSNHMNMPNTIYRLKSYITNNLNHNSLLYKFIRKIYRTFKISY